jgi:hypothetical protein
MNEVKFGPLKKLLHIYYSFFLKKRNNCCKCWANYVWSFIIFQFPFKIIIKKLKKKRRRKETPVVCIMINYSHGIRHFSWDSTKIKCRDSCLSLYVNVNIVKLQKQCTYWAWFLGQVQSIESFSFIFLPN